MRSSILLSGALLALPFLAPTSGGPRVGEQAPDFGSDTWFNNLGLAPSLENYAGQAVLLEFWATW